uniref:Phospholipase A2, group IVC (cytosolic, calcium-independent) n=1 Tax=Pygocentrus nattereri TaxID=42514 RepID=A0A3B4BM66_PYGNA
MHAKNVRIGYSLNEAEKQHVSRRRQTVLQCLKQHGISCSEDEVPNIAVLGSGGGLRAMVGLLGSLSQLEEEGLLDCIMYLSGVSGSTWCMSSLYKEPNWSSELKTLKNNIIQRLSGTKVSKKKMAQKLMKYMEKDNFSLTDVWTALIISNMVNEIDEDSLSVQRSNYTNNPYPIYTVIDKQCKHDGLDQDVWFEITPDESGYSLSGAFVDSSCLGSQFEKGKKIKDQPEMDMLYLQGKLFHVLRKWIWGRTYNYLNNMTGRKLIIRDYIDAGVLHNSPYFSVLRKERDIDLIISLDFSAGDPFQTVNQTAKTCKALQIPFPEVAVTYGGNTEPKDFYVFKDGSKAPTVIHIPLFNGVNCKGEMKKWEEKYSTFQTSYSHCKITDLLQKAGSNIKNNKDNLLKEIENIIKEKKTSNSA